MKKTGLAVKGDITSIISALESEIKSLDHITDSKYRTSGNLKGFGDIKTETKIENLIKAYSSIAGKETMYNNAATELGLTTYPLYTVDGSDSESWKEDIMLRINIINHKEKLDKLTEFKKRTEELLSKEEQKALLVSEISNFLNK